MAPDLYKLYHFTKEMHHDVYPSISASNSAVSVKGQTALITGGGSGIGLATAKFYAEAGAAHIVITGRTLASLETARAELIALHPQTNIIPIPADVGSKESVAALWKQLSEKDVKVDVLINNAGRGGAHAKIGEGDVDEWWEVQNTNIFGTYLMCDGFIRSLNAEGKALPGTIINVSSQMAFHEFPARSSYSVSKIAGVKLAQYIHTEHPNVRAFSVHPGIVHTAISTLGEAAKDAVELPAGLNLYLASPRADFLRGRYITANWDIDELEAHKNEIIEKNMLRVNIFTGYGPAGYPWQDVV